MARRIGGNPHHYLAMRLARAFEAQWPAARAVAPGYWAVELAADGTVRTGRLPDVLVNGGALLTEPVFVGAPDAVVEVWSPTNTLGEMNRKRAEYRAGGAAVLVEAQLTDSGSVLLEWFRNDGDRWALVAAASGRDRLTVDGPKPFTVVPDALLD